MSRAGVFIVFLFTCAFGMATKIAYAQSQSIALNKEIVMVTVERPPYTSATADKQGFLTEVVTAAFSQQGFKSQNFTMPWERAKYELLNGEAEVIYPASFDDIRDVGGTGVMLYSTLPIVLVKHPDTKDSWNGKLSSINGKSIVTQRGIDFSDEFPADSHVDTISVSSIEQAFGVVSKQRVDYVMTDRLTASYMLNKPSFAHLQIMTPPFIDYSEFYVVIRAETNRQKQIKKALQKGLKSLKTSGQYQHILSNYFIAQDVRLLNRRQQPFEPSEVSNFIGQRGSQLAIKSVKESLVDVNMTVIGFNWNTDGYQKSYLKTLKRLADEKGISLNILDAEGSIERQVALTKKAVDKGTDIVAIWPVHGQKIKPALEYAYQKGVPAIVINTPVVSELWPLVRSYIGPDNYAEGQIAAELMEEALEGKGKVVEIQGFPGYQTATLRSLGFRKYLQQRAAQDPAFDIEIIDVTSGYWDREKARNAMTRLLRRHDKIDGLYVADDNMGIGALAALEELKPNLKLKITSATLFGEGYDAIEQGKIWGSVWQSPSEEAALAIEVMSAFAMGEKVPFINFLPIKAVSSKNLSSTPRPSF